MKLNIYSIEDALVGFMNPFYYQNDEIAKRALQNTLVSDQPSPIKTNYKDMNLYRLGTFDDVTGEITGDKEFIAKASDFVKEVKNGLLFNEQSATNNSDAEN